MFLQVYPSEVVALVDEFLLKNGNLEAGNAKASYMKVGLSFTVKMHWSLRRGRLIERAE